jgi:hypothetical protein
LGDWNFKQTEFVISFSWQIDCGFMGDWFEI